MKIFSKSLYILDLEIFLYSKMCNFSMCYTYTFESYFFNNIFILHDDKIIKISVDRAKNSLQIHIKISLIILYLIFLKIKKLKF